MEPHKEPLLDLLFDRLAADDAPDGAADLILAAYAGEDALAGALAGQTPALPAPAGGEPPGTAPVYLEAVTVAGFRGIGQEASLRLQPRPGLTLVVGRNGSGKSSFAEAAEVCLTGASPRWEEHASVFRDGWRNLHAGSPCRIEITLRADGRPGATRIVRAWRDGDATPEQAATTVTSAGARLGGVADLGWAHALETYRPFLTADNVGRIMSSRPSTLFDALAPILGLDPLSAADKRLLAARKSAADRVKARKDGRDRLRAALAAVDDERARDAAAVLAKRAVDLDALDAVLARTAGSGGDPAAAACRRLADSALPDPSAVAAVADRMQAASAEAAAVAASGGSSSFSQVAALLETALAFHSEQGDVSCPVCRTGALDAAWREQASRTLDGLREQAGRARAAGQRRAATLAEARGLWTLPGGPSPADVRAAERVLDAPGAAEPGQAAPPRPAADLANALRTWLELGRDLAADGLPERIRAAYADLHVAFAAAREAAANWLRRRHDAWREPSAMLQTWLGEARRNACDQELVARINDARTWLKAATDEIRAARLVPFALRSQQVWEQLRQESNVELAGMQLEGTAVNRKVRFPATVDGAATQAMAVMSHGELQALGLAVFLPRACADDSPFRFVLIDDPVHSMDPAKVDGLAQVLAELSRTRQVIVFTHDNRLPDAIRRLEIDAVIWEVARRQGSVVELRKNLDPVRRYLDDAKALARTRDLPEEVRAPVVAGFCRSAIEAACHEVIRRERLARGELHGDVDKLIDAANTLNETMALALFGDKAEGGKVLAALNNRHGAWAGDVFQACRKSVHGHTGAALANMVEDAERLAGSLR